ncbi:MAG: hypothetical protein ABR969_00690 [Sedimentisphaerales bacterium]|jgi:hypothetical protein
MSEDLIYAMSTRGIITIDEFNSLFRMVYAPGISDKQDSIDVDIRWQMVRLLDSLGYCEFDFDNRKVYMCEPALVLSPAFGLPKAILVGARTPPLMKKIKEVVKTYKEKIILHYIPQSTADFSMPALFCIEAIDIASINELAVKCGLSIDVDKPAAWGLANFSASFDDLKKSMQFSPFVERNWKRRVFNVDKLVFSSQGHALQNSIMLIEYKNPIDQQSKHLLRDNDSAAEVNRDWGRYMALSYSQKQVILYNEKMQKLIIPVTVPLPCILARAVALCAGLVPKITIVSSQIGDIPPKHPVYVHSGVPKIIAELISNKLGQKIYYSNFDFDEEGALYD